MSDHIAVRTLRKVLNERLGMAVHWGEANIGDGRTRLWIETSLIGRPAALVDGIYTAEQMRPAKPGEHPWFDIAWRATRRLSPWPEARMEARRALHALAHARTHEETRPDGAPAAPLADWGIDTRQEDAGASGDDPCGE